MQTRIAIIDTGIDVSHPDLEGNVNADECRLFKYGEITPDTTDVYGHGTHVAGIAAASNDGTTGVVGTVPDAELVSLRVFYYDDVDGDGTAELTTITSDILLAIDYAASLGADAMNMSIGTPPLPPHYNQYGFRQAYRLVIEDAVRRGSVVVVSAGNAGTDLGKHGLFTTPNSVPSAMSVSATGPNYALVFYSNYGTSEVDIGAPGGGYETLEKTLSDETEWPFPTNLVLSSVPPELYDAYYAYFAGTSMGAPQVTGTAALVRSKFPELPTKQVEQALEQGADLLQGKNDSELGAGRVNATGALREAEKFR
ncbi:S8 family peptidase [Haladaptatus sp. NG-SE-30]